MDCTAETATCGDYGVSGYPTLKIFKGGEFSKEYSGPREAGLYPLTGFNEDQYLK